MSRLFSKRQKALLFILAEGKCSICKTKLKNCFHADHIIPFSKKGRTILENGQALCPNCNILKSDK